MARSAVPDAGDIAWLAFSPQAGQEQAGMRPAVVLNYPIRSRASIGVRALPRR